MQPWTGTIVVLLLAAGGCVSGVAFSRLPRRWWMTGYFLPFAILALVGMERWVPELGLVPPFSWATAGRTEYLVAASGITLTLTTPLSRLNNTRLKGLAIVTMLLLVAQFSLAPFLGAALARPHLAALKTNVDKDGVCHQSNGYTCGPAAAVTALKRLGIDAEESALSLEALTNPASGTDPGDLVDALQTLHGSEGVRCRYRSFQSIEELRDAGLTLAVVKFSFMVNHFVTVLEISDTSVKYGDPLFGIQSVPHGEFMGRWRRTGIVVSR